MSDFKTASKPEHIPELFTYYWNKRSAEGIALLFEEDAEFVNVVGLWWHNRGDIQKAHDYGLKVIFNRSELRLVKTKARMLSSKIAVVHSQMKLTNQSGYGKIDQPLTRQNLFTFVVQKVKKHWLCASAHNTDIVPGKETKIIDSSGNIQSVDYRK